MSLESSKPSSEGQRRRLLDDPVSIRALAHPLRLELQGIVARAGKATAAEAARELGISQALASHHLRQLAKYGFVEQVTGDDRRERPWRVTTTSQSWHGARQTSEGAAAADVLEQLLAEQALNHLLTWQERRDRWPRRWRDHTGIGQKTVYVTADEMVELEKAIEALIGRYEQERPIDEPESRPPGAVPVDFTYIGVPLAVDPAGD